MCKNTYIDSFLERLSSRLDNENVVNFYCNDDLENKLRLDNLSKYLNHYMANPPKLILIGEAPGYKGCALSGIPFTSQYVISESEFFKNKEYYTGTLQKENTATIMWEQFDKFNKYPLLWNAYPFHPHKPNDINTNRKPNEKELEVGLVYINILMGLLPKAELVAVGNVAHKSLSHLGLNVQKVRHPSYGGKDEFISGLKKYL